MSGNNLRGRIISMYGSVFKFANHIGWSTRKAYDIVNGKQEMTLSDIDVMCKALNVEIPEEMRVLFFD